MTDRTPCTGNVQEAPLYATTDIALAVALKTTGFQTVKEGLEVRNTRRNFVFYFTPTPELFNTIDAFYTSRLSVDARTIMRVNRGVRRDVRIQFSPEGEGWVRS